MFELNERTTACLLGTFRDEVGNLVPGSALTALTLMILDADSGRVIRAAQSVKNARDSAPERMWPVSSTKKTFSAPESNNTPKSAFRVGTMSDSCWRLCWNSSTVLVIFFSSV